MKDRKKSDLDETLNVTEAHDSKRGDSAAASREKPFDEGGREPMSLWILGSCAVILLVAGMAFGNANGLFNYNQTVRPGYVRADFGGADAELPPIDALKAYASKGQKIYGKCIGCHAPDGKGGGAYPSLAGSSWVVGPTEKLSMIILNGLQGPTSTGKSYGVMPAQGIGMSDADLAAVMTYIRNSFGNSTGDVVTNEMAAEAIKISESRANPGSPMDEAQLVAEHAEALPGEELAPTTPVDPITLQPVAAK